MNSIIVAMSENRVIGVSGRLPWHLSEDLKHFKEITMGHTIVMGRKTYESIGRALPGRANVVVTRQKNFRAEGVEVVHDLKDILSAPREIFVIGGADLYAQALPHVQKVYFTLIHKKIDGDTYFPEVNLDRDFQITEKGPMLYSEKEHLPYQFIEASRLEIKAL